MDAMVHDYEHLLLDTHQAPWDSFRHHLMSVEFLMFVHVLTLFLIAASLINYT
jgi:hypothetical protein